MSLSGNRILLVDDDPCILEALESALLLEGYEVLLARDGKEGLMRAERDRPDLIVMDLVMPRWSGLTILEHLRKNPRSHVPIIMMSGLEQQGLRPFVEAQGVEVFLHKPFCLDAFIEKVHEILPSLALVPAGV